MGENSAAYFGRSAGSRQKIMAKMRIVVDMQAAGRANRSGVGVYTACLVEQLAKNNQDTVEIVGHYYNFLGRQHISTLPRANNIRYKISRLIPVKAVNLLRRLGLNLPFEFLAKNRGDVYLFPNFIAQPSIFGIPSITVIHDLAFLEKPDTVSEKNRKDLARFVPTVLRKSKHIIANSQGTKQRIIDRYKISEGRISVVTPAINHQTFYPRLEKDVSAVRRKYRLPARYIMYTGTLDPRKNVEGILHSYAALDKKLKKEYGLVLAGGKGWKDESILATIDELRAAGESILTTGYVPDKDLPSIYTGASLFVYPSFYEGFGIPLLEAMACGVPVISADNTSLPEVVGSAGLYVKAEDEEGLTLLMERVLTNSGLASQLREKGFKQAKKFSWEKSAQELLAVLEKIIYTTSLV